MLKVYNMMIWYRYILWKDSHHQVNDTSITLYIYFFLWEYFHSTLRKLAVVIMLYIRSSYLFTLKLKVCTLLPTSLYFPHPQLLITTFLLYFYEFDIYFSDSSCKLCSIGLSVWLISVNISFSFVQFVNDRTSLF